jgi:hypothetical protein
MAALDAERYLASKGKFACYKRSHFQVENGTSYILLQFDYFSLVI